MKKLIYLVGVLLLLASCSSKGTEDQASSKPTAEEQTKKEIKKVKMILDLDTGIDDALALAYALADPNIELIGVVASFGNVTTEESATNTLNLLNMLNHKEVPVFKGSDRPIESKEPFKVLDISRFIHGQNGIGDIKVETSARAVESQDGVDFMVESAKKYGKDLVIVAVGPTTNLDKALKKDPKFGEEVGKIVIMGGALIVDGNVTHYSEANIYQDAIAANDLFRSGTPITMVGLDVTQRTLLTNTDTQKWRDLGTASGKAFADMVDYYIEAYRKNAPELKGCALHDPLAVAVAVDPELVKVLKLHMRVGTSPQDWGKTVAMNGKMNDPNPNISACVDINVDQFVNRFMDYLTELFKEN